jgi:predicted cation transporter
MKENPISTANSLALTIGIFYIVCRALVSLFPGLMFSIAQSWFHDIQLTKLDSANLSTSAFLLGLASSVISAWIFGYVYAYIRKLMKS